MRPLVQVPIDLLWFQLPDNAPGKAVEDASSAWDTAIQIVDTNGVLDYWLWPGPAPTTGAIWGVTQQMGKLSVSPTQSNSAFQINKNDFKKMF